MASATIQKIIGKEEIPFADRIEIVKILGWQCVVSKSDNFQIGDKVIFIEVDSVVPERPEFEFLRKYNFRVKTMKLKGIVSSGLVLPIDKFLSNKDLNVGDDISNLMHVEHYEKPVSANMKGQIAGRFPTYLVPKTDENLIQSVPDVIDELENVPCYVTCKIDGTSSSYILHNDKFYICSRNNVMKDNDENKDNVYVKMAHKYDIEKKLREYGKNIAIQGEIAGPGLQKNPMNLKDLELFVFNVYDIDSRKYLDFNDFKRVTEELDLKMVPMLFDNILFAIVNIEDFLEMAKGNYEGTNHPREGIVIRSLVEKYSNALEGRLSFKCINPEYLSD